MLVVKSRSGTNAFADCFITTSTSFACAAISGAPPDPGSRTGVKVAVVDGTGKVLETDTVYPFQPKNDLRGAQDPFGPPAETAALRQEMIAAGADWQISEFGKVAHGLTDPKAEGGMPGIAYDALADKVSWGGTVLLLEHVLG